MRTFESEPMREPDPAMPNARDRQEAVAEVRLGRRTDADRGVRVAKQVELVAVACVAWMIDVRGPRQPSRASSSIGRRRVLGETLLDLERLLVGMDVKGQLVLGRVAAQARASASAGQARTEWGATPTAIPAPRSASSSVRYSATESCRKRGMPPRR